MLIRQVDFVFEQFGNRSRVFVGERMRPTILDVDVHHGNGTQGIFYRRDDVLTVSLHADPERFYPFFWGYEQEKGEGQGLGYNLNLPLARGTGDDDFLNALDIGLARARNFGSDVIVVALGLDASIDDPFEGLAITQDGLNASARALLALACLPDGQEGLYQRQFGDQPDAFLNGSKVDAITSDAQTDGVKSQLRYSSLTRKSVG